MHVRPLPKQGAEGLLAIAEAFLVKHRHRLPWVHGAMFGFFVLLLLAPVLTPLPGEQDGFLDNYRRFANTVLWGLWFPLLFVSVVVTGRSWCGLFCPMGAASEWANARGPRWEIPAWMRWPGTPIVSFVLVTVWAQTLGARDHAESTAILFGSVMGLAILVGLVFGRRKRAWCRHMCPIGLLLGVYSRLGAVDFRPVNRQEGGDRWTEATLCPTMIDLKRKSESRHCIECMRCVNPQSKGGLRLALRHPGAEVEAIRDHHPNASEVAFLFLGTGTALGGFLWLVLANYQAFRLWVTKTAFGMGWFWIGEPGPSWLMAVFPQEREVFRWIDFLTIVAYMLGWMALTAAALSATTGLAAWLSGRMGGTGGFRERFVELGYQVAPVALVSLLIGLGGTLFLALGEAGLPPEGLKALKMALLTAGGLWSLWLGARILGRQGVPAARLWLPLLPGASGSLLVGAAWASAIL